MVGGEGEAEEMRESEKEGYYEMERGTGGATSGIEKRLFENQGALFWWNFGCRLKC